MGKDISTLIDDIYQVLDETNDHVADEENIQHAGELFKEILRTRFRSREIKHGDAVLRFSALGKRDRQMWYKANKPEVAEKLPPKTMLKFLYGDLIEILMLFLASEAGHKVTDTQKGVECDGVSGSIDCLIDDVLVDVKSASSFAFDKFKSGSYVFDDPFGYVAQLSGYANALGRSRAGFLVADKVHGDICFVELDEYSIAANQPGPKIAHQRAVVNNPEPPPKCYPSVPEGKSGNMKLGVGCSYCEFKDDCHSDTNGGAGLRKFFYSRGPVWLTDVKREPKVNES